MNGERNPTEVYVDFRESVMRILGLTEDGRLPDSQVPSSMEAEVKTLPVTLAHKFYQNYSLTKLKNRWTWWERRTVSKWRVLRRWGTTSPRGTLLLWHLQPGRHRRRRSRARLHLHQHHLRLRLQLRSKLWLRCPCWARRSCRWRRRTYRKRDCHPSFGFWVSLKQIYRC